MSLKATWIKIIKRLAIIVTGQIVQNTTKEKKGILYGDIFLENHKQNKFWKKVIESMYNMRSKTKPMFDFEYLSWPIWHGIMLQLPKMTCLEIKNVIMIADLLDSLWNLLCKQEIEENKIFKFCRIHGSIKERYFIK